jgi:diguanylate cyclase (GGDEF)-like protein
MADWALVDVLLFLAGGGIAAGGLLAGFFLGQYSVPQASNADSVGQANDTMQRLFEWTHGMSIEMAEYQEVVADVAQAIDDDETGQEPTELVGKLVEANRRLRARLDSAEENLRHQSEELAAVVTQAHTDSLTGLPNRRSFDDELDRRLAEFRRRGTPLSMLLIDVDLFKRFNDKYGHLIGDRVLRLVAQTLQECTRDSDLVARFGGEEFAVILPDTSSEIANLAAERIRSAIESKEMMIDRQLLKVTVSGGVSQAHEGDVPTTLIERADVALYRAKEAGRNLTYWHDGFVARQTVGSPSDAPDENFTQICSALRQRLLEVSVPQKVD